MREICEFADKHNLRIVSTSSSIFGGYKSRLIQFYKGYEFREIMIRLPQ